MQETSRRPATEPTPAAERVAYLLDPAKVGVEPGYPSPAVRRVLDDAGIPLVEISIVELLGGCLAEPARAFTALCVPGGFAPNYASRLGAKGYALIRDFVGAGGGYVGLCAGAFLGSREGLELLPVEIVDVHRWARGSGPCQLAFTPDGAALLGAVADGSLVTVRYCNGPLMRIAGGGTVALATFASEFRGPQGDYPPRMQGTPAIVCGAHGAGLVVLVSPHVEDGAGARALTPFANAVRLACGRSFYRLVAEAQCGLAERLARGGEEPPGARQAPVLELG